MKDYSFTITDRPVNKTAAMVMQKGIHYEWEHKNDNSFFESDTPIPIRNITKRERGRGRENLLGLKFGRFEVIGVARNIEKRWVVKCSCGKYAIRKAKSIKNTKNGNDMCGECDHLDQLKRHEYWKRTGIDK